MKYLMNGVFYSFLISHYTISFPHCSGTFDWIPFLMRMQLVTLLNAWIVEVSRLKTVLHDAVKSNDVEQIFNQIQRVTECQQLLDLTLKTAYDEAKGLRELRARDGMLDAPELDWEFWKQVYEHDSY